MSTSPLSCQYLRDRFRDYLTGVRQLSPLSVRNYIADLKPLEEFLTSRGINDPTTLSKETAQAYLAWLAWGRTKTNLSRRGHARSSVLRLYSVLRSFD